MSLALERLRTLRRQAGGVAGSAAADGTSDALPETEASNEVRRDAAIDLHIAAHRGHKCTTNALAPSVTSLVEAASAVPSDAASRQRDRQTIEELRRLLRVRAPAPAPAYAHGQAYALAPVRPQAHADACAAADKPTHAHAFSPTHTQRVPADRSLPGSEIAPGLHLVEHRLPWPVASVLPLGFDPRIAHARSADIVCFDTETTGLAGGTGTRAFMIGIAQWREDALHLRQWFITQLQAERALLAAFAEVLNESSVLVSYNGRSYDAPLLRTRFRLARMHEPLSDCAHVDLLHPTRRRYRGRWENCRLATIERRVLGVVREDDLPGSEAPAAWLRYLRGGCARDLARVAEHNRQDLASLAGLLLHLGGLSEGDASEVDADGVGGFVSACAR